ncbi:hypothetical protein [Pacificoceanicola onchidii]|uniref:hypothetical protein n=1 Tax=Pacificoceanicola onchidii TaxID=2562685 RepID=UPI0010A50CB4|nr:hypothetical protein [Pacificoceanicola onchidii]
MSEDDTPDGPAAQKLPLFVERQTYRRRRIIDAARALPVLGLLLWWVPLLWALPKEPTSASGALIYIFCVWVGLILGAALLILALRRRDAEAQTSNGGQP